MKHPQLPKSATRLSINLAGFAAGILAFLSLRGAEILPVHVLLVVAAIALPIVLLEAVFLKERMPRPKNAYGEPDREEDSRIQRISIKLIGFVATLAAVALVFWLLPEYHRTFYDPFYAFLQMIAVPFALLSVPYIAFVDSRMAEPHDSYWMMGNLITFRWKHVRAGVLGQHALGWMVKGFFLPLMFVYLVNDLTWFSNASFSGFFNRPFVATYDVVWRIIFCVDLSFTVTGYLLTLRLFDSDIRSTEPTFFGWAVALFCYQPFWSLFSRSYIAYETGMKWNLWLKDSPTLLVIWGCLILVVMAIYSLSTITFGIRFSNLTHRGILTNGPYRFTKHPAYVSKNIGWWMVSVPFLSQMGAADALRHSALLLALNIIYGLRAYTEERHLSRDPVYREYALWMDQHGMFRNVPFMRYSKRLSGFSPTGA